MYPPPALQQVDGGEHPEEHGHGLIDGESGQQAQAGPRRQRTSPGKALLVESPVGQQEGESRNRGGERPGRQRGPGGAELKRQRGSDDRACAEGLETAVSGTHERLVKAPCQQGDAGNAGESDPAQVFEFCRQRCEDVADCGIQGTPFDDSLFRMRPFGPEEEVGIIVGDAVVVVPDGSVARQKYRQKQGEYGPSGKLWPPVTGAGQARRHRRFPTLVFPGVSFRRRAVAGEGLEPTTLGL